MISHWAVWGHRLQVKKLLQLRISSSGKNIFFRHVLISTLTSEKFYFLELLALKPFSVLGYFCFTKAKIPII